MVDLTNSDEINKFEKNAEKEIGKGIEDSVKEIQEVGADVFGFGEEF